MRLVSCFLIRFSSMALFCGLSSGRDYAAQLQNCMLTFQHKSFMTAVTVAAYLISSDVSQKTAKWLDLRGTKLGNEYCQGFKASHIVPCSVKNTLMRQ